MNGNFRRPFSPPSSRAAHSSIDRIQGEVVLVRLELPWQLVNLRDLTLPLNAHCHLLAVQSVAVCPEASGRKGGFDAGCPGARTVRFESIRIESRDFQKRAEVITLGVLLDHGVHLNV